MHKEKIKKRKKKVKMGGGKQGKLNVEHSKREYRSKREYTKRKGGQKIKK
jgi:hypothetical protein